MEKGKPDEAIKAIASSLERRKSTEEGGAPPLARGRLLPAQVEIAIAVGDFETARAATDELVEFDAHYESPAWKASALTSRLCIAALPSWPMLAFWRSWS